MNDAAACQEAIAAGIDVLGENRVQEMTAKLAEHAYDGRPLHFIGHLQRNKVRQVVGKVALIQSVGSMELLREIEKGGRQAGPAAGHPARGEHRRRGGQERLCTGGRGAAAQSALELAHVRVLGLMAIPPVETVPHGNMRYFAEMRALYVDINEKNVP